MKSYEEKSISIKNARIMGHVVFVVAYLVGIAIAAIFLQWRATWIAIGVAVVAYGGHTIIEVLFDKIENINTIAKNIDKFSGNDK